jgi:hypothetical protein
MVPIIEALSRRVIPQKADSLLAIPLFTLSIWFLASWREFGLGLSTYRFTFSSERRKKISFSSSKVTCLKSKRPVFKLGNGEKLSESITWF